MSEPLEDYALIGDGETAALVSRAGSIDWLCVPRFDSQACFAALLGGPEHGRWGLAPRDGARSVHRRYRDDTLVLETSFETDTGAVTIVDCMPQRAGPPVVICQVVGNAFVQSYGARELDASLLMIPLVGFLTAEGVRGTVAAIERELLVDGFVQRYPTESRVDSLPPGEGLFLACSFWLVLVLLGRRDEARRLYDRLLALRHDVGLLAEQYDPRARRQLGNVPQALSHIALVNSACNLSQVGRPARLRADGG
jgi:GH15 family glucan-1,4-alpha-glucosidase